MSPINPFEYKSFQALPEDEKKNYKPTTEDGFVRVSAVENIELTHQLAFIEDKAYKVLKQELAKEPILDYKELVDVLKDQSSSKPKKKIAYDEKSKIAEKLRQIADVKRLQGSYDIDTEVSEAMSAIYTKLTYSEAFNKTILQEIKDDDIEVISHYLLDKKITDHLGDLIKKLTSQESVIKVIELCQNDVSATCKLINKIDNLEVAISYYSKIITQENLEYSEKIVLESTGKELIDKLIKTNKKDIIVSLVKEGVLKLSYCEKRMPVFEDNQEQLLEMIQYGDTIESVAQVLKFFANQEMVSQFVEKLRQDKNFFKFLKESDREVAKLLCEKLNVALLKDPQVSILSDLTPNEFNQYSNQEEGTNKFVVSIDSNNQYVVAFDSMKVRKNHQDIFKAISWRGLSDNFKSGGYLSLVEKEGIITITMCQNSGDYGCYSQSLMEHFRSSLEQELKSKFKDREIKLVIEQSRGY